MKEATCPICRISLSFPVKDNVRFCSSCRREFWPIQEQQKSNVDLQSDLEAVGSESGSSSPVLLSSEEDLRFFPESRKKKDYLQEAFGSHVKITSRVDLPT